MEGGSTDAYTWDAPSHVIESIDDFILDPQDNADQWFGKAFNYFYVYNIHVFVPTVNGDVQKILYILLILEMITQTILPCGVTW